MEVNSSNPALLDMMDFKAERVGRGMHALSGKILLNFDINHGDANEVWFKYIW